MASNLGPMLTAEVKDSVLGSDMLGEVVEMYKLEKVLKGRPTQEVGKEGSRLQSSIVQNSGNSSLVGRVTLKQGDC